ncbi:hypothetical protein [Aurantiacibacter gangjinensis]|uniref:Uncharacterized protein n=1 Tax=Aurantiacibacter gangjinensis TaxID=502682 RepID=A0A0G9MPN5_9SPHN|nr:hypothetical protein [Aurantiacibacter gangjinensis]APE28354.1 hypothetical protein BMF35_a1525 [Aurantiacibacter gangjinensis]KLE32589.1 hypothetical protein AAW01_00500 [Aurantiacibacter gangjinensis]
MMKKLCLASLFAVSLAGCDAAGEIAGEAIDNEIRTQVANQCETVASNAGVVAERITAVCECTADTFIDDPELTADDIRPARIEEIVNDCTSSTAESAAEPANETPAEDSSV